MKDITRYGKVDFVTPDDLPLVQVAEVSNPTIAEGDSPLYVRLASWDNTEEHKEAQEMQGKQVCVTIKVLENTHRVKFLVDLGLGYLPGEEANIHCLWVLGDEVTCVCDGFERTFVEGVDIETIKMY